MKNKWMIYFFVIIATLVLAQLWSKMSEAQYDAIRQTEKVEMPEYQTDRTMLKTILSQQEETLRLLREIKSSLAGMKESK